MSAAGRPQGGQAASVGAWVCYSGPFEGAGEMTLPRGGQSQGLPITLPGQVALLLDMML